VSIPVPSTSLPPNKAPQLSANPLGRWTTLMNDTRQKRAAEIQDSIRQILYRDWNPIGCDGEIELPEDEYDSCIAPVYRILSGSRSEQELIECLFRLERDDIGMACESAELLRPVARRLLELDVRL
jgi:hypothetical protein